MTKLRVGIIGLGMGRWHALEFAKHPKCDVVALADLSTDLLEELGNELKVEKRYTDAEEMLKNESLDIACIATPQHVSQTPDAGRI